MSAHFVAGSLRALWRTGCDFLYPPACPLCDYPLEHSESAGGIDRLCERCLDELQPDRRDSCFRCGAPVGPHLHNGNGCRFCRDDRFAFETVVRFGVYEGGLQRACLLMKHRRGVRLALCLADMLWNETGDRLRKAGASAVVAVPRHWTRGLGRHHHAAETLARALARRMDVPYRDDPLRNIRRTRRQTALKPNQRRTNVRGVFSAELPAELRETTLLLVDDVLTTGSTAHEAAKALRLAGAGRVVVAVIARGLGE